jgi:hypothetical protein
MIDQIMKGLTVALALFLVSCEGTTIREWKIENHSPDVLTVYADINFSYLPADTTVVHPDQSITIGKTDNMGGQSQAGNPTDNINSILVTTFDGKSLKKDFSLNSNWIVESDHKTKLPSKYLHTFTFVISDEDLE